jgi:hypothetical protein
MLEIARARYAGPGIVFVNQAVEDFAIETMGVDVSCAPFPLTELSR